MKLNQKYFPLFHSEGGLSSRFLIVSNMRLDDPRTVIEGNQRVVRPRLADARFFFETDKKKSLDQHVGEQLGVVYHNKLGSLAERVSRVVEIAARICDLLGSEAALVQNVRQAAEYAKADLTTLMVGEFPELQGTMGKYYALNEGIARDVAEAIEDHYKPRFSGDTLPRNEIGMILALADKLETLVGMFGIGQVPSGDKDPFALRRHAIGVIRILSGITEMLSLIDLANSVSRAFRDCAGFTFQQSAFLDFMHDRMRSVYLEQGFTSHEINAVLGDGDDSGSIHPYVVVDVPKRLSAVRAFSMLPSAPSLAAANKRIGNILKKAEGVEEAYDKTRMTEAAETALATAMETVMPHAKAQCDKGDYTASLQSLAALREPVDTFFDKVMVNADDPAIRANRLGLLATLHREMNRVADLSKLAA